MKYYLRSTSKDLETNSISVSVSERENCSNRNKNNKQDNKQKKSRKVSKRQLKGRKDKTDLPNKRKKDEKNTQNKVFHEKIMRFPLKYKRSTLRVYCFKQSDLGIPRRFSRRFIQHKKDDDQQSWDSLIESEIERCKNDLFNSVRKYSETLTQKTTENLSVKQELPENEPKKEEVEKRKKKITKREKAKK